jgi:hypothetical protein
MISLVNEGCPAISRIVRKVPLAFAVVVVGCQLVGRIQHVHGREVTKAAQGWLLINAMERQQVTHKRDMLECIVNLATGRVREHILLCLVHIVSLYLLIQQDLQMSPYKFYHFPE